MNGNSMELIWFLYLIKTIWNLHESLGFCYLKLLKYRTGISVVVLLVNLWNVIFHYWKMDILQKLWQVHSLQLAPSLPVAQIHYQYDLFSVDMIVFQYYLGCLCCFTICQLVRVSLSVSIACLITSASIHGSLFNEY